MTSLTRRAVLLGTASAIALSAAGLRAPGAAAATQDADAMLRDFTGGNEAVEGGIALELPESVENGASVPVAVTLSPPAGGEPGFEAVLLLAPANPEPGVATFRLSPRTASGTIRTRIRLAGNQEVVAVARRTDGTCHIARQEIAVLVGGCVVDG